MVFKKSGYGGFGMGEERPFNMAQLLLERIDKRFEEANQASIDGDVFRWYRVLRTIKSGISFKINDDKDKEKGKDKKEITIAQHVETLLNEAQGSARTALNEKHEAFYFEAEKTLRALEEYLIKLAYKYELYYPTYEKTTWQERAKEEDK